MGRHVFAMGGNVEASRFSGLRLGRIQVGVFVISGLMAGLAAFLGASFYGSASCGDATGYELYVIASAVVGGASLSGRQGQRDQRHPGRRCSSCSYGSRSGRCTSTRTTSGSSSAAPSSSPSSWTRRSTPLRGAAGSRARAANEVGGKTCEDEIARVGADGVAACRAGGWPLWRRREATPERARRRDSAAPPRRVKIAMIAKSSTNPVFLSARTGAEAAAKELSAKLGVPIEIAWLTPPQEDGQVQAQRIAQAVNEGASAVLISCSDAGKVTGAINDAVDRGVPVMTFDSDAPAVEALRLLRCRRRQDRARP